jgi:hypothetical protein
VDGQAVLYGTGVWDYQEGEAEGGSNYVSNNRNKFDAIVLQQTSEMTQSLR